MLKMHGIIPAILTPFKGDQVDYDTLARYTDWLINHGVHGLFPLGTTGEGLLLSLEERKKAAETVVKAAAGRVPILVHTGTVSTRDTIDLTLHAQAIGASAAAVVAPYYFPHDDKGLEEYYVTVAQAVPDFPIYIYNIPWTAKNDVHPQVVAAIVRRCPNVVGIKDSSGNISRLEDYIAAMGPGFTVITGTDALVYPAMAIGCVGVVSAVADVFPEHMVALYNAIVSGESQKAQKLQYFVNKLDNAMKVGPFIAPYKAALAMRDFPIGGVRPPLRNLTATEVTRMKKILDDLGVI